MDIAVIGASGDVGRQIAQQVVVERLLDRDQRLVLVGNAKGASARSTYGLAADLVDAYGAIVPQIEVELDPSRVRADLFVIAAGLTPKPSLGEAPMNRDALAKSNAEIFHRYAGAIASQGTGHEIVVCITNPVELAVAIFSKHLGNHRVMGMGSFLDSLRFREELATELVVRRQAVHAFMAGEHGSLAVPLWSGVHVYGIEEPELALEIAKMRKGVSIDSYWDVVSEAQGQLRDLIQEGKVQEAYAVADEYPPDVRVVVRPFVTHYSGAKTVIGTGSATMEFLRTITQGADVLVSGQVTLAGEAYGITGTIGVPFVVGNRGVDRVFELPIDDSERSLLCESARLCGEKIKPYL